MIQQNGLQKFYETNTEDTKGLKSKINPRQTKLAVEILLQEVKTSKVADPVHITLQEQKNS